MKQTFWKLNSISYEDMPETCEHENEHNLTGKKQWLNSGVILLRDTAREIGGLLVNPSKNPSGSIDRGYVSGFINSQDGTKTVYLSLNDGMQDVLYRTAKHAKDYTGGSNNTQPLNEESWEHVIDFIKNYFNS